MKRIDLECPTCGAQKTDVYVKSGDAYPACGECAVAMVWLPSAGATVKGDEIPGGVWIKNGICNADGSPKRYDSYSSMKKAADAKGYTNHVERGVADKKDYDRLTRRAR